MNIAIARENMIKQQLRTCEIVDENIINLLETVPREDFVPEEFAEFAFADLNIPIGHQQKMMTPLEEAKLIQAVAIKPDDKILEIGTGSGYLTALLAHLGKYVVSLDYFASFCGHARDKLEGYGIKNIEIIHADGAQGCPERGPYDVIVVTGSMPFLPNSFKAQLNEGGRIFAVIGEPPVMEAVLVTRQLTDKKKEIWHEVKLFETEVAPLINAVSKESFVF